jgi:hypothetical protein
VLDGVLDERLKRERWNHAVERLGVDPFDDVQPIAQAQLLEREIVADESQLLGQRDVFTRGAFDVEHVAEHVTEPLERVLRRLRLARDERGQRVQRVEEKVRVELTAQRGELGAHAEGIGVRGARLLFAQTLRDTDRVRADGEDAVDEQSVEHLEAREGLRRGPCAGEADLRGDFRDFDAEPREGHRRADHEMNGNDRRGAHSPPLEQAREPPDADAEERHRHHVREAGHQRARCRQRLRRRQRERVEPGEWNPRGCVDPPPVRAERTSIRLAHEINPGFVST